MKAWLSAGILSLLLALAPGFQQPPELLGQRAAKAAENSPQTASSPSNPGRNSEGLAVLAAIEGPIGPATTHHIVQVVKAARERGAVVLILRIDTPGGLATSMREVISIILESPVPVVGWVAPPGAHAASAGTYILYATHVAAMAPGTNLGAATPVMIGGGGLPGMPGEQEKPAPQDKDGSNGKPESAPSPTPTNEQALSAKAVNDAVAFIRSLAELHGRNAEWAERAVREAASLSAQEALNLGVIDLMAEDREELLTALDGREVTVRRTSHRLATAGLAVEELEPGTITEMLALLSNPNVAFILMMVGVYGLIFEFSNPGSIGPGVIGVTCLVLGLYGLNQLPLDYAGLALVALGLALMVAEAFTPSLGVLGIGGLVAFIIGGAMLVDTEIPEYQLSWSVIGGTAIVSGAMLILVLGYVWRAHHRPVQAGAQSLLGSRVRVIDWHKREDKGHWEGHVWAQGERWRARGKRFFSPGEQALVEHLEGLILEIKPTDGREEAETGQQPPRQRERPDRASGNGD